MTTSARHLTALDTDWGWAQQVCDGQGVMDRLTGCIEELASMPTRVRKRWQLARELFDVQHTSAIDKLDSEMVIMRDHVEEEIREKREELRLFEKRKRAGLVVADSKSKVTKDALESSYKLKKDGHERIAMVFDGMNDLLAKGRGDLEVGLVQVDQAQAALAPDGNEFKNSLARNIAFRANAFVSDVVNLIVGVGKVVRYFGPAVEAEIQSSGLFEAPARGQVGLDRKPKVVAYQDLSQVAKDGVVPRPRVWINPKLTSAGQHILHHGVSFSHSRGAAESARAKRNNKETEVARLDVSRKKTNEKKEMVIGDLEHALLGVGHPDLECVTSYVTAPDGKRTGVTKLRDFVGDMQKLKLYTTDKMRADAIKFKKIKSGDLDLVSNVQFMEVTLELYTVAVTKMKRKQAATITRRAEAAATPKRYRSTRAPAVASAPSPAHEIADGTPPPASKKSNNNSTPPRLSADRSS
jgi:hypothetical protein